MSLRVSQPLWPPLAVTSSVQAGPNSARLYPVKGARPLTGRVARSATAGAPAAPAAGTAARGAVGGFGVAVTRLGARLVCVGLVRPVVCASAGGVGDHGAVLGGLVVAVRETRVGGGAGVGLVVDGAADEGTAEGAVPPGAELQPATVRATAQAIWKMDQRNPRRPSAERREALIAGAIGALLSPGPPQWKT
jgi:hypothetical protein